jgi:hypothetical protein
MDDDAIINDAGKHNVNEMELIGLNDTAEGAIAMAALPNAAGIADGNKPVDVLGKLIPGDRR